MSEAQMVACIAAIVVVALGVGAVTAYVTWDFLDCLVWVTECAEERSRRGIEATERRRAAMELEAEVGDAKD